MLRAGGRHVFEIESDHIHLLGECGKGRHVIERANLQRCHLASAGIGYRIEDRKAYAERRTGKYQHARQLAATQNAERAHWRGSSLAMTSSVCLARNCASA